MHQPPRPNRRATVTTSATTLGLFVPETQGGAPPVLRPIFGGPTTGFHYQPIPGTPQNPNDTVLLLAEVAGWNTMVIPFVHPQLASQVTQVLQPGESVILGPAGQIIAYAKADGSAVLFSKSSGASVAIAANGNITASTPAAGTIALNPGSSGTLSTNGNATVSGTAAVTGAMTAATAALGGASLAGNVLAVTGNSLLTGNLNVTGTLTVGGGGGTPSVTPASALTGLTVSVVGSSSAGRITLSFANGTGLSTVHWNTFCTLSFGSTFATVPFVQTLVEYAAWLQGNTIIHDSSGDYLSTATISTVANLTTSSVDIVVFLPNGSISFPVTAYIDYHASII